MLNKDKKLQLVLCFFCLDYRFGTVIFYIMAFLHNCYRNYK